MQSAEEAAPAYSVEELTRKNIETIQRIEQASHEARSKADIFADRIATFCGSITFVWVHCLLLIAYLVVNSASIGLKEFRFDPTPHPILATALSIEAILLSTFILISQNRERRLQDRRNLLDLQINLLAEQEASQLLCMMRDVMSHLGMGPTSPEVAALQEATDTEKLVEQIEEVQKSDVLENPRSD